jgi:hypothetical protein
VDAPVAPVRVLVCKADDQSSEFRVDWRSAGCWCWWLRPMTADSLSVPSRHCFGFDDQKRGSRSSTIHRRVEHGEECSIGVGEPRPADLALENEELVAKGEDLCARVTGSEYPPETGEYKAHEGRKKDQERKTLPASPTPETRGITGRMSIRHARSGEPGELWGSPLRSGLLMSWPRQAFWFVLPRWEQGCWRFANGRRNWSS